MTAFARLWSVGAVQNTLVETQPPINLAIWLLVRLVAGGLDSVEHAHGVRSTRSHNRDALANARRTGTGRTTRAGLRRASASKASGWTRAWPSATPAGIAN